MTKEECMAGLSDVIFWDMNRETADLDKHATQFIPRVLEYGTLDDWHLIRRYYGLDRIVEVCKGVRSLDPVCLSFVCTISDTNKEDYRCYHFRQLFPTLWNS